MVRKLALVMALSAAGLPNGAAALGLGDIDLNSYLNQPLEAEIPLRISSPEELQSLRVSLASRSDFARAGIDYQSSLRQLEFDVVRDGGKPVIRVTSDGDFREPYVSFLLEVNWSRGRIMREYTLLVDPPVIAGQGGAAVSAPQVQAQPQTQTQPRQTQGPVTVPERRSVAAEPRGLPAASRSGDSYGPTQRDSTLWSIANEVRPDSSVTVEQTMMALQRLNPEAFIDGNVNQLKAGYVLKVPDRELIAAMTAAEARAEFRRQTQAWRRGDDVAPESETTTTAATPTGASQGRLQLLAPEGGEGAAAEAAVQQPGETTADAGAPVAGSAAGSAEGTSEQNEALRQRIDQLQQQVQDLERLAQLKDDQLATLQAQLQSLQGGDAAELAPLPELPVDAATAPTEEAVEQTAPEDVAAEDAAPMMESAAEPAQPSARAFGEPVSANRAAPGQADNPYVVSGYEPVDLNQLPSEAAPATAEAAPADTAEPAGIVEQISAWWQKTVALFKDNPLYLGIAVGVLLILLLAAMAVRQRRRAAAGFGESILQPAAEPQGERATAAAAVGGAATAAAIATADEREQAPQSEEQESSYLSDFSISGIDSTIESEVSEADPLTEADVFLAYGRYQPAENMIKEAIEAEPERLDLKVKLLEIYYAARNGEAFEQEAQTVHSLMEDHSDPAWQKVVEMGRDLRPDSPLFSDTGFSDAGEAVAEEPALDEDFGLSGEEFDLEQEQAAVKPAADDNLIDFDLGEMEEVQTESQFETAAATGTDDAFERRDVSQELAGDLADELSALSGDLDADSQTASAPADEVADFDLSDLDLEPEAQAEAEQGLMEDLEASSEEAEEDVLDGGLLSDGDEVGTKLDLARAYIDMGDPDGARSILDEVLEEGSEDQKNEAEGLMAQIS